MSRSGIFCFLIIVIFSITKETLGSYDSNGNINYHGFNETKKVVNNFNLIDRSNEDMYLTSRQLIRKYGYRGETHRVTTEDGYVLEMHRITGPKSNPNPAGKPVIFLMHGIVSSSVDWIIIGPESGLGYFLANQGYDVWMGNARGNKYSRKHKHYSVLSKEYWQFSWHEIGVHDLPAMIDYILATTKSKSLTYVGHSQGTTAFWVMASTKPQYNKKINSMFALAPIAYVGNVRSPLFRALLPFDSLITGAMEMLGSYEFKPTEEFTKSIKGFACDPSAWSQPICENIILIMAGLGTDQLNKTHLPIILGHVPAGASVKQFIHYAQLIKSGQFRQFDYGFFGNMRKYGKSKPPAYDLSKVTTPVFLHYCLNDYLAHVADVDKLTKQLPNVHAKLRVQHNTFSHLDYVWGVDVKDLVYKKMLSFMNNFREEK